MLALAVAGACSQNGEGKHFFIGRSPRSEMERCGIELHHVRDLREANIQEALSCK